MASSYADHLRNDTENIKIEEPVFLKCTDIPSEENQSTAELCKLAENISGYKTIEGAQRIGGLWRIYPQTREARAVLLVSGLKIQGVSVPVHNKNPYLMMSGDGEEIASTRVTISNVPLSGANEDIVHAIEAQGVTILSKLRYELARDGNNRLTRFKTGRRFLFIAVPDTPLPRRLEIGIFKAEVYHKEQRQDVRFSNRECYNCLERGHHASVCPNPVKCRDCKIDGHKSGDPACGWVEQAALFEQQINTVEDHASASVEEPAGEEEDAVEMESMMTDNTEKPGELVLSDAAKRDETTVELSSNNAHAAEAPKPQRSPKVVRSGLKKFIFKRKPSDEVTEGQAASKKISTGTEKT